MENNTQKNNCPLIKGMRELTERDFSLEHDAGDWDDSTDAWSYYLSSVGNMDEIFGTNVETSENDDYINVYVFTDFSRKLIQDFLYIALWKANGDVEEYNYRLSEREKRILRVLILEYEIALMTKQLKEEKIKLNTLREVC